MGYTRDELARELQVSYTTIYRWETGQREIPPFLELALDNIVDDLSWFELAHREIERVLKSAQAKKIIAVSDEQLHKILKLVSIEKASRLGTNPQKGKTILDSLSD